jgi:hypothetical protein
MSDVKTTTVWRCLDAQWIDTDKDCDAIALTMQRAGAEFAVVCSGPKGMKSNDFIPAVHAALAALTASAGGDLSVIGASTAAQGDLFDTGDQRAN